MSILNRISNWKDCSLSQILWDLQNGFNISTVTEFNEHACESGIWIHIRIKYNEKNYGVGGSRLDVVKKRLIDWVDNNRIRDDFLIKNPLKTEGHLDDCNCNECKLLEKIFNQ